MSVISKESAIEFIKIALRKLDVELVSLDSATREEIPLARMAVKACAIVAWNQIGAYRDATEASRKERARAMGYTRHDSAVLLLGFLSADSSHLHPDVRENAHAMNESHARALAPAFAKLLEMSADLPLEIFWQEKWSAAEAESEPIGPVSKVRNFKHALRPEPPVEPAGVGNQHGTLA